MEQKLAIILINPAAHHPVAKADVPAELTLVLTVAAEQELVALPAHLLQAAVVLQVQEAAAVVQAAEAQGAAVAHFALTEHAIQVPMLIFQNV